MKKVGIYTPYLDSFGGGERYMLTIAEILSFNNDVHLLLDSHLASLNPAKLKDDLGQHLNLDLSKVKLTRAPLGLGSKLFDRVFFLRKYDVLFYLTDGSLFYSTAKKSIVHFQVPFKNTNKDLWNKVKLSSWDMAIFNSKFTKDIIEKEWNIKGRVIYPPVEVEKIKPLKKEKIILSVGRFVSFNKLKKHEEMIKAFSDLYQSGQIFGWTMHLAGSLEGDPSYIEQLKKRSLGLPIEIHPNLSFEKLLLLYGKASIYWHAAGFEETDPAKMEHFGITTVEAMAGGCVPIVINKGGQTEIVEDRKSGMLWDTLEQLQEMTLTLIKDPKRRSEFSKNATVRSQIFSKTNFKQQIQQIVGLI